MDTNQLVRDVKQRLSISELIISLYWEYDRLTSGGKSTLNKLAKRSGVLTEDEITRLNKHKDK
tara:strand:- start:298 stop:486 length:189 start_codon:yes stop_codon:yes gene_type:complete